MQQDVPRCVLVEKVLKLVSSPYTEALCLHHKPIWCIAASFSGLESYQKPIWAVLWPHADRFDTRAHGIHLFAGWYADGQAAVHGRKTIGLRPEKHDTLSAYLSL